MNPERWDSVGQFLLRDRIERYKTGAVNYMKVAAPEGEPCALPGKEAYEGYMVLAETSPNWRNQVTIESLEKAREFVEKQSYLAEVLVDAVSGNVLKSEIRWNAKASGCVVLASGGYPLSYEKGKRINGLKEASALPGIQVFHAGTGRELSAEPPEVIIGVLERWRDASFETAFHGFVGTFRKSSKARSALGSALTAIRMLVVARERVGSIRWAISVVTGTSEKIESPRSPCTTWEIHLPN
jgi:hypothetical protein